jgi:hypothetical protein
MVNSNIYFMKALHSIQQTLKMEILTLKIVV